MMDNENIVIPKTDFSNPESVVINFILSAKNIINNEKHSQKDIINIMAFYTTIKYHPYDSRIHILQQISYIKEIEKVVINKLSARIVSKAIKNLIPSAVWDLIFINKKWKVCDLKIQRGTKRYYSLVNYKSEKIDDM